MYCFNCHKILHRGSQNQYTQSYPRIFRNFVLVAQDAPWEAPPRVKKLKISIFKKIFKIKQIPWVNSCVLLRRSSLQNVSSIGQKLTELCISAFCPFQTISHPAAKWGGGDSLKIISKYTYF